MPADAFYHRLLLDTSYLQRLARSARGTTDQVSPVNRSRPSTLASSGLAYTRNPIVPLSIPNTLSIT